MSTAVETVAVTATVLEAAERLINAAASALPVVDDNGFMVGIVSEADLIGSATAATRAIGLDMLGRMESDARAAAVAAARSRGVAEVMTRDVIAAHETASLREIADLMLKHAIKRVPILRGRVLLGMVGRVDLVKALLSAGSTATPPAASPAELRGAVLAALRSHGWMPSRSRDIVVTNGTVHLWGMVASDAERTSWVDAAAAVPGVLSVESHMHVARNPFR